MTHKLWLISDQLTSRMIFPTLSYFEERLSYQSFNWPCSEGVKSDKSSSPSLNISSSKEIMGVDFESEISSQWYDLIYFHSKMLSRKWPIWTIIFDNYFWQTCAEIGKSSRSITTSKCVIWAIGTIEVWASCDIEYFSFDSYANSGLVFSIVLSQLKQRIGSLKCVIKMSRGKNTSFIVISFSSFGGGTYTFGVWKTSDRIL